MPEEMRKRLEEAAREYEEGYETTERVAFTHGAVWMFKECGGMTVLHDMRKMILAQCKEWLKENYHLFDHFDKDEILADFERDILKLWEEK